jgi:hypothetical protein
VADDDVLLREGLITFQKSSKEKVEAALDDL